MLLIYLPEITPRTEYIFKHIFWDELGIKYQVTSNLNLFDSYDKEKINYSQERIATEFFIKPASLLFENTIKKTDLTIKEKYQVIVLFSNDSLCDLGFDIFSAVFYMVSRYEEYLPFKPDKYGRFSAFNSLSFKNNFLQYPVVDIWMNLFKCALLKKFPLLTFRTASFNAIATYDIDVAYAFKGRSIIRNSSATIKDLARLKFKNILKRVLTILKVQRDPWDTYDFLHETISRNNLKSIFFFLLSDYSQHDKNLNYKNYALKELVNKIFTFSETGIHPSFRSSLIPEKITTEKKRLEQLVNKKIIKSRQHYLKFTLPDTYNFLLNAGITEDYSMCFADMPGFRAGTCKSFYFYDLKNERSTGLKIFPVVFMEGTYMEYLQLSPSAALDNIFNLIEQVKNVNGTFISIWHNNTVSETHTYKPWKDVHNKMIERIQRYILDNEP